ncbi:MAG: M48 family metallopeptidase [Bacilli bacterium]|nr:M48 family metallopeptidase [Bacilli bacterium]
MKFKLNDYIIEYEVIRKDNKNLYFRIDENCKLVITAPRFITDDEIRNLITKNSGAILKMYEDALQRKERNGLFWYLGNGYEVTFDNRITEIKFEDNKITCHDEDALNKFYNDECLRVFNEEIEICKNCFSELPDFDLKIRKMRTRWGVCNTKTKTITLNSELLKKDISLIDYVIIHEMTHFFEGNHGKHFWELVSMAIPDYKERRKKLRY